MKTQSAKNKGRVLQQWVRDKLLSLLNLREGDVRSTSMGAQGEDVLLSPTAADAFPYSIECKNVEKVNVWASYAQSVSNSKDKEPLLIIKKNRHKPLAVVDAEYFIKLHTREA